MMALVFAYALRFGPEFGWEQVSMLLRVVPLFAAICVVVFPASGLYSIAWRFPTALDVLRVPRAVIVASGILVLLCFFGTRLEGISRLAIIIEIFVLTAAIGSLRFVGRFQELRLRTRAAPARGEGGVGRQPAILVGSSLAADHFIRALYRDPASPIEPIGLLDDDPARWGLTLRGIPIIGGLRSAETLLKRLEGLGQRPRIIFTESLSEFGAGKAKAIVDLADRLGLEVSRLPCPTELRDPRKQGLFDLRPIELTDLLARQQTVLDLGTVRSLVKGRRVLVTGAGGSIGSELSRQLAALAPGHLILADNCEFNLYSVDLRVREEFGALHCTTVLCDVRDASRVEEIFDLVRPELIFHAAALKHVPIVELNPDEGALTNAVGSRNVADAALRVGALAMVQVSTDKAVNTTNVMGATKRVAELYCQALDLAGDGAAGTRFMTVRFGNVLGSSGSLIPLFERQLARGGPLTVTDPAMQRYFMTTREAVELTLQASARGFEAKAGRGEIFVLEMGDPILIVDIARRMISLAGLSPGKDVEIEFVGTRPGEKLHEELFDQRERLIKDGHIPGVIRALPIPVSLALLRKRIAALEVAARRHDANKVVSLLSELVEGYRPSPEALAAQYRFDAEGDLPATRQASWTQQAS